MKVVFFIAAAAALLAALGCGGKPTPAAEVAPEMTTEVTSKPDGWITLENGLQYKDVTVGQGEPAAQGNVIRTHYTGWLYVNGTRSTEFDSSRDGQPIEFRLGAGRVIRGWDQGIVGMRVGGVRNLIIPPELAYGERGSGNVIPPGATLEFEVELVAIVR